MPRDDDAPGFNDFSEEEQRKAAKHMRDKKLWVKNHPLMLQAVEINAMLDVLLDTCDGNSVITAYGVTLRDSARLIRVKLDAALHADSYIICMENAAVIREHAQHLRLSNHTLRASGDFNEKYLLAFRQEIEKFRSLFMLWANEIRSMKNDRDDEWNFFIK